MNDTETPATTNRIRAALAALLVVLVAMFGTLSAPAAFAAGANITAEVANASESGLTIQVAASGLPEGVTGTYAALIVQGQDDALNNQEYVAFALPFPAVSAGSSSFALTAPLAKLDRSLTYEVVMWKQHSSFTPENLYGRSVVSISDGQWDAVFPPAPEPEPEPEPTQPTEPTEPTEPEPVVPLVETTVAASAADGLSVSVAGTQFGAATGVYAALIEEGTEAGVTAGGGFLAMEYVRGVTDGAFSVDLIAAAAELDAAKAYEVIVWKQHTMPDADTILARDDVLITAEQWNALQPSEMQPAIEVFLADGTTPAGDTRLRAGDEIVVKGSGYDPAANIGGRGVPIPKDLPQGTYVVFGDFAANWQPSAGAASSSRSVGSQLWALAEGVLDQVPTQYQSIIRAQWVDIEDDGTFVARLTLKDAPASPGGGAYGVYTYAAGGVHNAAQERGVPVNYATEAEAVVASAVSVDATDLIVNVTGEGFADITGAYVALIEEGTETNVTAGGGFLAMQYVRGIADGAFATELVAAGDTLDSSKAYEVIVWQQHTMPTADTIYVRGGVTITPEQWTKLKGEKPKPPVDPTDPPTTPTKPTNPAKPVAGGSLRWAISSSFVNYITGDIAQGQIFVSGGATRSGGQFQFGQAAGSTYTPSTGVGAVSYNGSVRFTGHHGVLDVTVSNPRVEITSSSNATLYVTHGGSRVAFATVNLAAAAKTTAEGAVTYTAAPTSLTSAGRDRVLDGNSTNLNPVTFTIGTVAPAPNGTVGTVAAASVEKKAELPSAPPASDGIHIDDASLEALQTGASATVSASGFQPNERGIKVVVYSTPVQLATVDADANGVATWTGTLPATLEDGAHTLTFQGSVDRGLEFTLARTAAAIGQCTVEGATLNWGYKESFRNYIEGIAHGGWDLTGVVYEFPEFVWSGGTGSFDQDSGNGLVDFGGTIAFHGHDGALDTKLNNARVELAGDTGYIVFDVAGTTQAGEAIDAQGVRFVEFSLADATTENGSLSVSEAETVLTDSGSAAFGTYAAGESFDPVSFSIPVGADCGVLPVDEGETAEAPVAAVSAAVEPVAGDAAGFPLWAWVVVGLLVVGAGVGTGVIVQRRRAAASATISED